MQSIKKRIFDIIQIGNKRDIPSRIFDIFIVTAILLNITITFLETFDELKPYYGIFAIVEFVTMVLFLIEYALRIWTVEFLYPNCNRLKALGKFLISYDGIVQLLTILPFFFLSGFVALRMLRVVRILHLFRINSNYDSFHVITSVFKKKKNQIFSSIFIIVVLMLASSLFMYSAEHAAQPEAFDNAFSGIWWSISTILTVGYGDIYPITVLGRVMGIIIAVLGVGVVAIPTGIISAGFVEQYTQMQRSAESPVRGTVKVQVDETSPFLGLRQKELEVAFELTLLIVIRNGEIILDMGKKKIRVGDTLIYQTTDLLNEVD